jgi:hypothetical protein
MYKVISYRTSQLTDGKPGSKHTLYENALAAADRLAARGLYARVMQGRDQVYSIAPQAPARRLTTPQPTTLWKNTCTVSWLGQTWCAIVLVPMGHAALVKLLDGTVLHVRKGFKLARRANDAELSEAHKAWLLKFVPETVTSHPLWSEYVLEGEHEDGVGYWGLFKTPDALVADFRIFVAALEGT